MDESFEPIVGARAALRRAPERGLLRVTGADRQRFLNGMLTNDVAALAPGALCAALQLDRKGHVQAELTVLCEPEALWLDVANGAEAELRALLDKHLIADDVRIESKSAEFAALELEGPDAGAALARAGLPSPASGAHERGSGDDAEVIFVGDGALGADGRRILAPRARIDSLVARLALPELDASAFERVRIARGVPRVGVDVGERNFPHEANLLDAVSFKKGCYIGQEIVARIASRGAVNRTLVRIASAAPLAAGAEIRAGGAAVGQITSVARGPSDGFLALGYVRVAEAQPGAALEVGGASGTVLGPASRR